MRFYEDIEIGQRRELGSFTFKAEDIKRFARQFDPQRFHLSEEEGRNSLFGGLAASGWHVASVCMKMIVADGQRAGGLGAGLAQLPSGTRRRCRVLDDLPDRWLDRHLSRQQPGPGSRLAAAAAHPLSVVLVRLRYRIGA